MLTLSPTDIRASLRDRWRQRYQRWLQRRLPAARVITLSQRRLFIFPARAGFLFLAALLLMLLTAINFQNNLAYALTFWLGTLFVIAIHFTHGNLMNLRLTAVRASAVFPGQRAEFVLRLESASGRGHRAVRLSWEGDSVLVDVPERGAVDVSLFQTVGARGWYSPERVRIESTYPLGWLRCWSFASFDWRALVWPKPLEAPVAAPRADAAGAAGQIDNIGGEDLAGFRNYRPGDSLRHVDWRSLARGQALQTRVFAAPVIEDHWLSWSDYPDAGVEQRLSWLCWRVLQHDQRGDHYGLRLPDTELAVAGGDRQREHALRALALFGHSAAEPTAETHA